jgi:hypothetical protein
VRWVVKWARKIIRKSPTRKPAVMGHPNSFWDLSSGPPVLGSGMNGSWGRWRNKEKSKEWATWLSAKQLGGATRRPKHANEDETGKAPLP